MEIDNIPNSLVESLKNDDLDSLAKEGLELTIDSLLDDGIVKNIPVISSVAALVKTTNSIGNWIFLRKIINFLKESKDVSLEKRQKMIDKINNKDKFRHKVGDYLLYLLDHSENDIKASNIGWAFRAFLEENISYEDFIRCANVINSLSIIDFYEFINPNRNYDYNDSLFIGNGLLISYTAPTEYDVVASSALNQPYLKGGEPVVELTKLGETLKRIFKDRYNFEKANNPLW